MYNILNSLPAEDVAMERNLTLGSDGGFGKKLNWMGSLKVDSLESVQVLYDFLKKWNVSKEDVEKRSTRKTGGLPEDRIAFLNTAIINILNELKKMSTKSPFSWKMTTIAKLSCKIGEDPYNKFSKKSSEVPTDRKNLFSRAFGSSKKNQQDIAELGYDYNNLMTLKKSTMALCKGLLDFKNINEASLWKAVDKIKESGAPKYDQKVAVEKLNDLQWIYSMAVFSSLNVLTSTLVIFETLRIE